MFYTIGEMAKQLQVAPSTLRYYDKEGLLPFVRRSDSGIRMFQESDLEWLNVIKCLKHTGMPIKEIKIFIDLCLEGDSTISQRLDTIKKQREMVKQQVARMQEHLSMLDYKCWYYEQAKAAGTCEFSKNINLEQIPEEFKDIYAKKHQL